MKSELSGKHLAYSLTMWVKCSHNKSLLDWLAGKPWRLFFSADKNAEFENDFTFLMLMLIINFTTLVIFREAWPDSLTFMYTSKVNRCPTKPHTQVWNKSSWEHYSCMFQQGLLWRGLVWYLFMLYAIHLFKIKGIILFFDIPGIQIASATTDRNDRKV